MAHVAAVSSGLVSAFVVAGRTIEAGFFKNVAWACIAFAIWIGGWTVQFVLGWLLEKMLMCCHPRGYYSEHSKTDKHKHAASAPLVVAAAAAAAKKNDDLKEVLVDNGLGTGGGGGGGRQQPTNAPMWSTLDANGIPRLISKDGATTRRIGVPIGVPVVTSCDAHTTTHATYKHVVIPFIPDKKQWHGHGRSQYESFVRLTVISVRVVIVLMATILAFSVAGVNFYSLVTGFGLISISFSYAASGMISGVFCAIYMYSTNKLEMHDYVTIGPINGEVTAFLSQWIEITDDCQPWKGRIVYQCPNKVAMETIVAIYPNGPGIAVLKSVTEDLEAIDRWIASNPKALQQLQAQHLQK